MPALYGSVTPSAAAVATAASTALPPRLSTRMPMRLASGSTDETAPPVPRLIGVFVVYGAGRSAAAASPASSPDETA
jgi:hypothetical protein